MAKHVPELFKNRSATQEFLFSHSDETVDAAREADDSRRPPPAEPLDAAGRLDREGLVQAIDARMAEAASLCALALAVDREAEAPAADGRRERTTESVAPLADRCRENGGIWARIGRRRFACVFTHRTAAEGEALGRMLLDAASKVAGLAVTIGLAAFPTLDYARRQVVDNAEKALDHGLFFGPGTITGFDAVSLNISGDRRYQAGDIAGAIEEFTQGLRLDPNDANLHNSLGVCYGVLKQHDRALACFERADQVAPDEVMAVYNKGYVHLLTGDRDQALACFLEADAREPEVFEVVYHIGQVYMEMGDGERARPYLEAATRANSRSAPVFRGLGACLEQLGLIKEAIQAYKSAVKINPADADSLSLLGVLYARRGESLDVAAVLGEQSVRLDPQNGLFHHRLGTVYLNQGRLDEALAAFASAAERGTDSRAEIADVHQRRLAAKAS